MININTFLARQAIYDRRQHVIAYELLFRNSNINSCSYNCYECSEDDITLELISNCSNIGFRELTNDKKAFINFTQGILLQEIPSVLSNDRVVIEILENVNPTIEVIECIKILKKNGYTIALDDVVMDTKFGKFDTLIDIYKIDFVDTTKESRKKLIKSIKSINPEAKFLAEKIENEEEYKEAKQNDYSYFQGYYFGKPTMISNQDISVLYME